MVVEIIGNRLVKTIRNGDTVRKVVTEVVDGKTFTKVLDKDGHKLVSRAKKLSTATVGDKQVNTIEKVTMQNGELQRDTFDRVYKDGELVGRRATREIHEGDEFVKYTSVKSTGNGDALAKTFAINTGKVVEKVLNPYNKVISHPDELFAKGYGGCWSSSNGSIKYNHKGFPLSNPLYWSGLADVNTANLSALRNLHVDIAPDQPYAHTSGLKLDFLNNRQPGDNTLNNLDKFLK